MGLIYLAIGICVGADSPCSSLSQWTGVRTVVASLQSSPEVLDQGSRALELPVSLLNMGGPWVPCWDWDRQGESQLQCVKVWD